MKIPTQTRLIEAFGSDKGSAAYRLLRRLDDACEHPAVVAWAEKCYHDPRKHSEAYPECLMLALDAVLGGYGDRRHLEHLYCAALSGCRAELSVFGRLALRSRAYALTSRSSDAAPFIWSESTMNSQHGYSQSGIRERLALLASVGPQGYRDTGADLCGWSYDPRFDRWFRFERGGAVKRIDIRQEGSASLAIIDSAWHMSRREAMAFIGYPEAGREVR